MLEVIVGKVKWFDTVKGYGFLAYNENGHGEEKQVFVHYSAIEADGFKNLEAGQDVEFCIIEDTRGKHAINVRVI